MVKSTAIIANTQHFLPADSQRYSKITITSLNFAILFNFGIKQKDLIAS